jgi:hypothetical protein
VGYPKAAVHSDWVTPDTQVTLANADAVTQWTNRRSRFDWQGVQRYLPGHGFRQPPPTYSLPILERAMAS